jgi:hypothetical protein
VLVLVFLRITTIEILLFPLPLTLAPTLLPPPSGPNYGIEKEPKRIEKGMGKFNGAI